MDLPCLYDVNDKNREIMKIPKQSQSKYEQ